MKRILACLLLLSACNREERPQGPTQEEAERLDQAEALLNGLANEEGAAPKDTAPSNQSN